MPSPTLLDPWQPALLDLIARCADAGRALGKPVGICGESAADPALAPVFAGMGITSLSMSARAIPIVRRALAARSLSECEHVAKLVLSAGTADAARALAVRPPGPPRPAGNHPEPPGGGR